MKHVTIVVTLFLAAAQAECAEPYPRYGNDLDCPHCAPMEFDRLVALLGDDALRDIVCRLSSQGFTPGKLSAALGMPEGQVMRRVKTLQGWGLVRLVRHEFGDHDRRTVAWRRCQNTAPLGGKILSHGR